MQARLNTYKKEGRLALKHMWIVLMVFGLIQFIVSVAVAAKNNVAGGLKSATFASIWSFFLVIILLIQGAQVVFGGQSSEIAVGFMIGTAAMLTELFFVLMCIFFVIGQEAQTNGIDSYQADQAYAAFSLINMILYFVWAILLTVHRETVVGLPTDNGPMAQKYESGGDVVNPAISSDYANRGGEDAEL